MEFLELAKERYSLRKFSDKKVEDEKLDKILECARVAPTAVNFQPQRILVLDGEEVREKMQACTKYAFNPPMYLLVCYDKKTSWKREYDGADAGEIDASIAAAHMMFQATELGLGTCWVGAFDPTAAKREFNIPADYEPVVIMPIGYPAENAHPAHLHEKRRAKEEIVFYGSFDK